MTQKSVLITNDLAIYNQIDIATIDLVIFISNDGMHFNIIKNRFGPVDDYTIPIALLPRVIKNPSGNIIHAWV